MLLPRLLLSLGSSLVFRPLLANGELELGSGCWRVEGTHRVYFTYALAQRRLLVRYGSDFEFAALMEVQRGA